MTWLFVRISPVDEINMPVPAARPWARVVLMLTNAGSTFDAIAATLSEPVPGGTVPLPPLPGIVKPGTGLNPVPGVRPLPVGVFVAPKLLVSELLCTAIATPAPTPADAKTSASAATIASPRRALVGTACAPAAGGQPGAGTGDHPGGGGPHAPPPPELGSGPYGPDPYGPGADAYGPDAYPPEMGPPEMGLD